MAKRRCLMSENKFIGSGMTSDRARNRLIEQIREAGINNEEVLWVMSKIPRHIFLPRALESRAYENIALPIGHGQTISQPYIVALMTELLLADTQRPLERVLEIGTGCGYQTAVLAQLCSHVYSIERISELMWDARNRLYDLKIKNTSFEIADGYGGWPENSPFDGILAAAASEDVPEKLLAQLAPGGRLVMPVGDNESQVLKVITRNNDEFIEENVTGVRFVAFKRGIEK